MTEQCATIVGVVLQVIGAAYLVYQARTTSRTLASYKAQVTYDNLGSLIETLARELAGQYSQQLVGFGFLLVGTGFQLYAAIMA